MNDLELVPIHDTPISVIEFAGERVLPFSLIDQLHGKGEGVAKSTFTRNRHRFIENKDFFEVCREHFATDIWENLGFHTKAPNGFLLTETGYVNLAKSFTDDLAWDIQRELVERYFVKTPPPLENLSLKEEIAAANHVLGMLASLERTKNKLRHDEIKREIIGFCRKTKRTIPNFGNLAFSIEQADLFEGGDK